LCVDHGNVIPVEMTGQVDETRVELQNTQIDLGKISVGQKYSRSILLVNKGRTSAYFTVEGNERRGGIEEMNREGEDDAVTVSPPSGIIPPLVSYKIMVEFCTASAGTYNKTVCFVIFVFIYPLFLFFFLIIRFAFLFVVASVKFFI
jgi:hypothetical protein